MEEDVLQFLRSKAVPQEDIIRKVDKAVLSFMTDEQMARYMSSYGDRVAVLSFCQQAKCSTDKHTLLQKLRDKIGTRKMKSKAKGAMCGTSCVFKKQGEGMARHRNNVGESTSRKIEIGWLHFSNNDYQQVRTRKGGGTRHATVEKTTNIAQILQMGRELFFPNGLSTKGRVEDFTFHICDFKRHQLPMDGTVGHLYEQTKLKLLRFYICTREQAPSTDEESPEVDQCTVDSLSKDSSVNISEGADLQLTSQGAHSDVDDSTTDQLEHGHAFDSDTSEQNLNFQMKPKSKRQRLTAETVKAQSPGKSHYFHSTPEDIRNPSIGQVQHPSSSDHDDDTIWNLPFQPSHGFPDSCFISIDPTSVVCNNFQNRETEHLCHETSEDVPQLDADEADTFLCDPEKDLSREYGDDAILITWNYKNEDVTQSAEMNGVPKQDLCLLLSSANLSQPPLHVQPRNDETMQTAQDSGFINSLPQDLPLSSSSHLSPSASAGNSGNPITNQRHASIRRVKVVEDLLAVFMDSKIINLTLKMDFVNEKAIDDAGVSREVYTAFWEQLLEQCEGEMERVPRLRPEFCEAEWQAVGRIWVKGLLDHGVMPERLSKAFIVACIHGIDSVDVDILMTSFLNYLSPVERSAVEKALQGSMEESDEDDLLDLFTRMGSHVLPPKKNMEAAIHTMAHKAILQEPKYIVDCFSAAMAFVQHKLSDKESVLSLYESKKATGKRVSQLLETTNVILTQREQATFNHLQRYVKNADQNKAEKFLRFCTGSSVICVEKIMVSFNAETGLGRRPVAHTCGATLEVPCTYTSFPEFCTEFDNILSSNYFEMDIL